MFWSASYSTCVVYTKTIIHLSVGESGGYLPLFTFIIHQIFFARAIGLNTSRDAAKTGKYQMIFPSDIPQFRALRFTFERLAFIPSKLLKRIKLNTLNKLIIF